MDRKPGILRMLLIRFHRRAIKPMKKYLLLVIFLLLFFLPILVLAAEAVTPEKWINLAVPLPGATGGRVQNIGEYINLAYKLAISFLAIVCVLALLIGGIRYILSAGNASKAAEGMNFIKSSIIGLILGLASFLILNTINPQLTVLTVPGIENISKEFATIPTAGIQISGIQCPDGKNTLGQICLCKDSSLKVDINKYCCLKADGKSYESKDVPCAPLDCSKITTCEDYRDQTEACLRNLCHIKSAEVEVRCWVLSTTKLCALRPCEESGDCTQDEFCNKQATCEARKDPGAPCDDPELEINNIDDAVCKSGSCGTLSNVCNPPDEPE